MNSCFVYIHDNGSPCITCRAANEETIAPAAQYQLLDQFDHQPHPCRALRMPKYER